MFYVFIVITLFLVFSWLHPTQEFIPTGIILPMSTKSLVPSMNAVKLFHTEPDNAIDIAYINVEGHSLDPNKQQESAMLEKAKALAKKAGGDGLVINIFAYEPAGKYNPAPLAKYFLLTKVIKLKQQ